MRPEIESAVAEARSRAHSATSLVDSLSSLPRLLLHHDGRPILVVADAGVHAWHDAVVRRCRGAAGREVGTFSEFTVIPTSGQCIQGARAAIGIDAAAIVALGGGTAIDVATAAALGAAHPADPARVIEGRLAPERDALPVIAIPTTAGTGSEATHFAVVYVDGVKRSLAHASLLPAGVVLDVEVSATCPARIAAAAGLDALCQCMESLWASGADDRSRADARLAGRVAAASIVDAVRGDADGRRAMMWASHLAGHAINRSRTTAPHAASYAMSARHGVPHGIAVALTIGHFARRLSTMDERACRHPGGIEAVRGLATEAASWLGCDVDGLAGAMRSLLGTLGVPDSLRAAGIASEALAGLAAAADPLRLSNHPERLDEATMLETLAAAW
jgi:alcohol dehydrogenase class IV